LIDHSFYCVQTPLGSLDIHAPDAIAMGLRATLNGVNVSAISRGGVSSVLDVFCTHQGFSISRPATGFHIEYSDYVDCLNEVLLQLAYELMRLLPGWHLLHCSAVQVEGVNLIAFGEKHAGKSVWAFEKLLTGGTLLADDLLAWNRELSQFICLGQSTRLRRPVSLNVFDHLNENAFIPGKSLSYIKKTHIDIAACGYKFEPDYVVEIEPQTHQVKTLSMKDSYARLTKGCIPAELFYNR